MPPRSTTGSSELGLAIRERRTTLGLSIEEAATSAGLGTKTWSRYESGAAIRKDKVRGLCKALGWTQLPLPDSEVQDNWLMEIGDEHEAWSKTLSENYGRACAVTFAVGSDLLTEHIDQDLESLAKEPRGTHIGQLDMSWLDGSLPPQFIPRYDYEFVYALRSAVHILRERFAYGRLVAETVLEELALYLIFSNADFLIDMDADMEGELFDDDDDWREWLGEVLGDLDVQYFLFGSRHALSPLIVYHYDHWQKAQFYVDGNKLTSVESAAASLGLLKSDNSVDEPKEPNT